MDRTLHLQEDDETEEVPVSCSVVRCRTFFNRHSLINYCLSRLLKSLTCQGCFLKTNEAFPRKSVDVSVYNSGNNGEASRFLHKNPLWEGILSSASNQFKSDAIKCCSSFGLVSWSRGLCVHSLGVQGAAMDSIASEDRSARESVDCGSSTVSVDASGDGTGSETLSLGTGEMHYSHGHGDDIPTSSAGSSPLGWPIGSTKPTSCEVSTIPLPIAGGQESVIWEEKREKRETDLSEVEMMKERFSKLLLGEDMSGGGKGVCTALAISNAITNLSATVFGQLWRLEPLVQEKKSMWRREMEWLLSVSDYIVELIPAFQNFPDGSSLEVMVSRPRSDLQINLPALRKLDTMLLDALESFRDTEFWYVDQGILVPDTDGCGPLRRPPQRQEEKWWLPIPRVPPCGLSDNARKRLHHQRECTNQILKAAMAINSNVLSEMEVPEIYLEALPKNGKSSLGDIIYRYITAEQFSPDCLLDCLDLSSEHHTLEIANRIEAAIHVWRRKRFGKQSNSGKENRPNMKSSWGIVRDFMGDKLGLLIAEMNAPHQIGEPLLAESGGSPSFCTGSPAESCTTENYASSNSGDAADGPDSGCVQSSLGSDFLEEEQTAAENEPCGGTGFFRYQSDSASGRVRNKGLSKGMRVEVCSSEEGYGGAWFEGVILTFTTGGRRCKIRYDKFVTDDGKPLVEEVWLHSEVRPIPPHIQLPLHCSVGDAVEAYDTDCWWRGVIVKHCEGAEEDLWVVYFPDTCTLKAYPHSELRPAQEWLRGGWILAPQDRSPVIEQVIQSLSVVNSKESPRISVGKGGGKRKREAVKCKAACLGGRASGQTKRLKVIVSGTVYVREIVLGNSRVMDGGHLKLSREGTRPHMENDE